MTITEIRIKLIDGDHSRQRLRAFCSITFDGAFAVRDLKILEGNQGYFIAMPSRKLAFRCPACRQKNSVGSNFCCYCGANVKDASAAAVAGLPPHKQYVDVVHPINSACREEIHRAIIAAYEEEKIRAQAPGYVSAYDEYFGSDM